MGDTFFECGEMPAGAASRVRELLRLPDAEGIHSFTWNLFELLFASPQSAPLLSDMEAFLAKAHETLLTAQRHLLRHVPLGTVKICVIHHLEAVPLLDALRFSSADPVCFYRLQAVEGRVVKLADSKLIPKKRVLACLVCGATVSAVFELGDSPHYRGKCPALLKDSRYRRFYQQERGGDATRCGSTRWRTEGEPLLLELTEAVVAVDRPQLFLTLCLEGRQLPRPEPGSFLLLYGYTMPLLREVAVGLRLRRNKVVFRVLGLQRRQRAVAPQTAERPMQGAGEDPCGMVAFRNRLLDCLDRGLASLDHLRLALLLFLVGAAQTGRDRPKRPLSLLLIGDPATGKSRVLALAEQLLAECWAELDAAGDTLFLAFNPVALAQTLDAVAERLGEVPPALRAHEVIVGKRKEVVQLRRKNRVLRDLRTEAIKENHLLELFRRMGVRRGIAETRVRELLALDLEAMEKQIAEVVQLAQGELVLESMLTKAKEFWYAEEFQTVRYHSRCVIIRGWEELMGRAEEDLAQLGTMRLSQHFSTFEGEVKSWHERLSRVAAVLAVLVANFIADSLYVLLDPRTRES